MSALLVRIKGVSTSDPMLPSPNGTPLPSHAGLAVFSQGVTATPLANEDRP